MSHQNSNQEAQKQKQQAIKELEKTYKIAKDSNPKLAEAIRQKIEALKTNKPVDK